MMLTSAWRRGLGVSCGLAAGAAAPALAADFSFTGELLVGKQAQFLDFTLAAPAAVSIRTFHFSGGTNAAGQLIPAGGFDPVLHLYNRNTGAYIDYRDDISIPLLLGDAFFDAYPLPAGNYRVALTKFNYRPAGPTLSAGFTGGREGFFGLTRPWAVDILNVTSAALVAPVNERNLACLDNTVTVMPTNQIAGPAQRRLLLELISLGRRYLDSSYEGLSSAALKGLITRTNGCGERTVPDAVSQGANEIDFVTSCAAQSAVQSCLATP